MEMHLNKITLSFTEKDQGPEKEFREFLYRNSLTLFRWAIILGILLYAGFGILDALYDPAHKEEFWFIRFAIVCPVLTLGLLYSFHNSFKRYWQFVSSFLVFVAGIGVNAMLIIADPPTRYTYYVGIILVVFYGSAFINTQFKWAASTSLTLILCYEISAVTLCHVPFPTLLQQSFFAVTALIIAFFSSYSRELAFRKNFYLLKKLSAEKKKVSEKNKELERILMRLKNAQNEIKTLTGLIPICAKCKKIRDDQGYWNQLEAYLSTHTDLEFSHSICPACAKELYGNEKWFKGD